MAHDLSAIRPVLEQSRRRLLSGANVVATGIGYKVTRGRRTPDLSIVCSVTRKRAITELAARDRVPATLDSIPTDVVETGMIRVFAARTERHRPAPGGVSIGHRDITAGTLGCLVKKNGAVMILSNNHVLANSNDAQVGDAILQPGPLDGGRVPDDQIAELAQFVPIVFLDAPSDCRFARAVVTLLNAGCRLVRSRTRYRSVRVEATDNLVDAAIARPLNVADVSPEILEVGRITGQARGELGLRIKKSGRTTGVTTDEVQQMDVTVNVQYGAGRVARFTDQLMAGPMSQGGDSGSTVLDADNHIVGLLFAGSDQSTVINRVEHVFSELGAGL